MAEKWGLAHTHFYPFIDLPFIMRGHPATPIDAALAVRHKCVICNGM